jgi:hypothetical protein
MSGFKVSIFDASPVDNLPNFVEIRWSEVLVLEIVSMFPDINSQERGQSVSLNLVLRKVRLDLSI